jgi:hypothetical protein
LTAGQLRAPTDQPDLEQLVMRYGGKHDYQSATMLFGRLLLGNELSSDERAQLQAEIADLEGPDQLRHLAARILSRPEAFVT